MQLNQIIIYRKLQTLLFRTNYIYSIFTHILLTQMKKSPFIQGFRQPTLSKNSYFLLSDVLGDGEGKLVIWSEQQTQLIVYKGSNREIEKLVKLKNVCAITQYYDQQSSAQPVIALAAQNGFYIFRGFMQSFRLKIPDVIAEVEEQMIWSQYQNNLNQLSAELMNIKSSILSQKAKYFLSASSDQRKKEIIQQVFVEGISEKDSISAVSVMKQTDTTGIGNVVVGTQLNRLYILDTYGHKIIHERIIEFAPCLLFAYGKFESKYLIICISREGRISIFLNPDKNEPSEQVRLNTRVNSGDLSYPDFAISTADCVVSVFSFNHNNLKISVPKYSYKLNQKPIKIAFMRKKGVKLLILAFDNQFRIMREKQIVYRFQTDYKLTSFLYGSFAREQSCLILLYENNGFQVLIGHRLFNPKQNYQQRKAKQKLQTRDQTHNTLQFPKKTSQFLKYWNSQPENINSFKMYERSMKLLKWRTLQGANSESSNKAPVSNTTAKIQINPKILGLGPNFIVKLQIENISNSPIYNIKILVIHQRDLLQISKYLQQINMLTPFTPILKQIQLKSLSLKAERFKVQLSWKNGISSTIIYLPACAQMQD